ncbi:hypothetical protein OIU79_024928 [Salix purpurea]|uniref:Uncharacterized protein n=1 Tax=Salix purpurea TaxID=77065 RepID=A0A9Q1A6P6_SALPP|nr:hypothetical protein OIU79_024928 [Salix purpurea]
MTSNPIMKDLTVDVKMDSDENLSPNLQSPRPTTGCSHQCQPKTIPSEKTNSSCDWDARTRHLFD